MKFTTGKTYLDMVIVSVEPSNEHPGVVDVLFSSREGTFQIIGFKPDGTFFRYLSDEKEDTYDCEEMGLTMDLDGRIKESFQPQ